MTEKLLIPVNEKIKSDPEEDAKLYAKAFESMRKEWYLVLSDLWTAFGKPVDQKRMQVYARQMNFIPLGLLEKSISIAIQKQSKYNIVPTVGSVIEALKQILGDPFDLTQAIEEWADQGFKKCAFSFPGE